MNNTRELVWAGLADLTSRQTLQLVRGIQSESTSQEDFGHYIVLWYDLDNNRFLVILDKYRRDPIACGIAWPQREAAIINLNGAQRLLKTLRITGEPSVYVLYTGPVRVG